MGDLAHHLGGQLRAIRQASGVTQHTLAARCGTSQPALSRMELGNGGSAAIDTWSSVATALGLRLEADLSPPPSTERLDRLRRLVLDLAEIGGWSSHTAEDGLIRLVRPVRREVALVATWDVVADVDLGIADFLDSIRHESEHRAPDWRVSGVMVIQATGPNRRRLGEMWELVDDVFPDSGARWIGALGSPTAQMPGRPGFCWASHGARRLTPARLPLIHPRRGPGDRR